MLKRKTALHLKISLSCLMIIAGIATILLFNRALLPSSVSKADATYISSINTQCQYMQTEFDTFADSKLSYENYAQEMSLPISHYVDLIRYRGLAVYTENFVSYTNETNRCGIVNHYYIFS
ncbi:MAG: hypothetical protein LBE09_07515 [Christensenellaceae bacterium]|jgi:hypothetical protein|nr:hypothetical protein [Christensenellaceae bacterium]